MNSFEDIEAPPVWKVKEKRLLIDNQFIRLYEYDFVTADGLVVKDYYIVERKDVVVMMLIDNDRVFLVKEFERGLMVVGDKFPSGYIDEGEEPLMAAKRELREELGLTGRFRFLGFTYVNPGTSTQKGYIFLVDRLEQIEGREDNPFERFSGGWINLREFEELIVQGRIHNQFVLSAYGLFKAGEVSGRRWG